MKDATISALLALVPDTEPCAVCADRPMLATRLLGLPCLAVVQCPLCQGDQPARVIPTTDSRGVA